MLEREKNGGEPWKQRCWSIFVSHPPPDNLEEGRKQKPLIFKSQKEICVLLVPSAFRVLSIPLSDPCGFGHGNNEAERQKLDRARAPESSLVFLGLHSDSGLSDPQAHDKV